MCSNCLEISCIQSTSFAFDPAPNISFRKNFHSKSIAHSQDLRLMQGTLFGVHKKMPCFLNTEHRLKQQGNNSFVPVLHTLHQFLSASKPPGYQYYFQVPCGYNFAAGVCEHLFPENVCHIQTVPGNWSVL